LAAEAAGLQGRYWEMHDVLYREQAVWSKADNVRELFDSYAGMLGLNLNQFKKDMESEKAGQRIESDQERADSLGVRSTPTVFINNQEVAPNEKTPNGLRAKIDAALKQKSSKA
jgi:protein-disulfide isomerase